MAALFLLVVLIVFVVLATYEIGQLLQADDTIDEFWDGP